MEDHAERPPSLTRRHSQRLERRSSASPYGKPGSGTGLTCHLASTKLDWGGDDGATSTNKVPMSGKMKSKREAKKGNDESKAKSKTGVTRTSSFRRLLKSKPKGGEEASGSTSAARSTAPAAAGSDETHTVFISCSALLREVKLCVQGTTIAQVDEILTALGRREIRAEQAVNTLMDLVGNTLVQQAGLSVMNLRKGLLPHGWLEYLDETSGRTYYYNVHNQVTTWDKPAQTSSPSAEAAAAPNQQEAGGDGINITCMPETHSMAMTGFI